ncbi:hypothetical protein FQN54_002215 [Arachnomyces sp. PD_36]|nr:hypothetical protein FQN54_002215 [Arachnomyces sp. PD_36]
MEHVPTLCAIGTVGIAAAGFALGRPDRSLPLRFASDKRQRSGKNPVHTPANLNRGSISPALPARMMPPLRDEKGTDKIATHQATRDGRKGLKTEPLHGPTIKGSLRGSMRARLRRQTNGDSSLRDRDASLSLESSRPSTAQRPSSSWLQRISISSPRNGSSQASSRPDSPSMTGSTAQMLPPDVPLNSTAPNKLVKRSTSQRAIASNPPSRSLGRSPTTPGLRRPATSHQRASTPRYGDETHHDFPDTSHCLSNLESLETPAPTLDDIWRPYFAPNHKPTSYKYHRRRANSASPRGDSVRRLTAEPDNPPTLLLATSVTPETRQLASDNGKSSRTPPHRPIYDDLPDNSAPFEPTSQSNQNRNLSLSRNMPTTDGFSTWDPPSSETRRKNRGYSLSQGRARNLAPNLEHLRSSNTERITPHPPGLRRRRNITDPTVFQRPMEPSQDEICPEHANSTYNKSTPAVPPLPPPRRPELDIEMLGLSSGQQMPVPDGQAPSQRQRHPTQASQTLPLSHPRSKRFSATTSDPASTLMGSDNDTRVFTSGDEDETDFQSETAYDSFPNRATGRDSVSRGPRIETIFDQPSPLTKGKLAALEQSTPTGPLAEKYHRDLNRPEYGNVHGMAPGPDFNEAAAPPLQRSDLQASAAVYGLHSKTPAAEPNLGTHISEADHDPEPGTHSDRSSKHCLFDWSEQHKGDRDSQGSAFRPRTVHGKNEGNARATRTLTRRGPSILHLRSQSVPVSRDPNPSNESQYPSMKFGTWGLGNKGVSEDWDGDFEFEEAEEPHGADHDNDTTSFAPRLGMKVPQAIMERQASVHGQFGHVKELTLLVEELRRLRLQAKALCITDGPSNELWKEAEGIINLATVDDDQNTPNPPRSPPSPTINLDWCDDESPRGKNGRGENIYDSAPNRSPLSIRTNYSPGSPPDRVRSLSSAKAQSVLDTIYQQRKVDNAAQTEIQAHPQQRLPFDTQSLRDLVVRAGVVTRALKEIIRRAQNISSDFDNDPMPQDPPFSQIFTQPSSHHSASQGSKLLNGESGSGQHEDAAQAAGNDNDISAHMKMMTVV